MMIRNKTLIAITAGFVAMGTLGLDSMAHATGLPLAASAIADPDTIVAEAPEDYNKELSDLSQDEVVDTVVLKTRDGILDTAYIRKERQIPGRYHSHIHLLARSYGDSIVLRWAPEDYVSWQYLNTVGVNVIRYTVLDPKQARKQRPQKDTLAFRLKPATLQQWQKLYPTTDSVAMVAAGALYSEGGFTQEQSRHGVGEMGALLDVHDDQQFRFGMAVLASEWRPDVAERLAMRLVDRNVKKGEKYRYIVRPAVLDTTGNMIFRTGHIEEMENKPYEPEPYNPVMGDSVVGVNNLRVWWERTERFSSFDIHRRSMGSSEWVKLNDNPYIMMTDINDKNLDNFVEDKVPGPGTYEYRISGYDAFGDYVQASSYHVGTMPDIDAPLPPKLKHIVIDRRDDKDLSNEVYAEFHFYKDTMEADFAGYKILYYKRSTDSLKANWVELTPVMIPKSDTVWTVNVTGMKSGQVTVAAYDTAQNVSYSLTHIMRVMDMKAPEPPKNLRYEVLDNAAGVVKLTWTPSSDDADYYELAYANDTTHVFMLRKINGDSLLRDTVYIDTLAVDVNQKYIYYKVRAVDYATNTGRYSDVLQVIRPSMIKPGVAQIDSAHVDQKQGIYMRWICSDEQQVSHHVLWRRLEKGKKWTKVAVYDGDSIRQAGCILHVMDKPDQIRRVRYEYVVESVSYAGITSGPSLAYSVAFEGEHVFEWPIKLYGTYDTKKKQTRIVWETDANLPYKGEWYFCVYRKGPNDKRPKFLMNVKPEERVFEDYLLSAGETAEYYVKIRYRDGRATTNSNTVKVEAPSGTANKQ